MKIRHRIISLVLLILMLASAAGCTIYGIGDRTAARTEAESTAPAITVVEDTTDDILYVPYPLPDYLDFNGEKVGVITWADAPISELSFEDDPDDIVAQTIYSKNVRTEEGLGVDLVVVEKNGTGTSVNEWITYVSNCVKIGSDDIDIVAGVSYAVGKCALQGLLFNMLDQSCNYLDFKQPYWYESFVTDARVGDGLYFATGDISANLIESMNVCYANYDLIKRYSLPDPEKLALDGEWTFEQLVTMSTGVYTESEKIYGFAANGLDLDPWFYASGARYCETDAELRIVASPSFSGEKVTETVKMLSSFLNSPDVMFPTNASHEAREAFASRHSLFIFEDYGESHTSFSGGEVIFSILPIPKYDEKQERYYTVPQNPYTLYAITANAKDSARASAILECLASNAYGNVTPAMHTRTVKLDNFATDSDSLAIYDLLRESLVYDHGRLFADELIGQYVFRNAAGNTADWQSYIGDRNVNRYLRTLDITAAKLNDKFDKANAPS